MLISRELNRFDRGRSTAPFTTKNSNTRIVSSRVITQVQEVEARAAQRNLGLNSKRAQEHLLAMLAEQGIQNKHVLNAMRHVPRHVFIDQGLASRAYENEALPIGYGQTISQPWMVARMLSLIFSDQAPPQRVLEIGAGCGYQTAVLSYLVPEVYAIERIHALYKTATANLQELGVLEQVRLKFGDGMLGWPSAAPFDAIVVAAAGTEIPYYLLEQLSIGGCLVAPEGDLYQQLVYIRRSSVSKWQRYELESVRFVPLKPGTQI